MPIIKQLKLANCRIKYQVRWEVPNAKKSTVVMNLSVALVLSFTIISICLAFAQSIYSGVLSEYLSLGIRLTLLGSGFLILIISIFSTIPIAIARPQDEPLPLIILMIQALALNFYTGEAAILTVLFCLALTAALTGLILFLFGLFKWGNFVRFVPYPVVAGFLASAGFLLILNVIEQVFQISHISMIRLNHLNTISGFLWVPTVIYGLVLFLASERLEHPFIFPVLIIAGLLAFYTISFLSGTSISTLQSLGLLIDTSTISMKQLSTYFHGIGVIQWPLIGQYLITMLIIAFVSVVSLLFITLSLELILKEEIDFNKELKVAGAANCLSALVGGIVGYHGLSNTVLAANFKLSSRISGILCAITCFFAFFYIDTILNFLPKFILFGIVLFLGLSLAYRWTLCIRKFNFFDKAILITVILVSTWFGFLQGITVGIFISILFFIIAYSKVNNIRYLIDGQELPRIRLYEPIAQMILKNNSKQIAYFKLQDYIFFGSAHILVHELHHLIKKKDGEAPHLIIYDFERVSGMDSSVEISFEKILDYAMKKKFKVILTGFDNNPSLKKEINKIKQNESLFTLPKTEDAIYYCETTLLQQAHYDLEELETQFIGLEDFLGDKSFAEQIPLYFETQKIKKGDYLARQGAMSHSLFYLESGRLAIFLKIDEANVNKLLMISPGNLVGEIGFYLHSRRSASIIADSDSIVKVLSKKKFKHMQKEAPELTEALDQAIIQLLAEKLVDTTKKMVALSR